MPKYLLALEQPDTGEPAPEGMEQVTSALALVNRELRASGSWVFTGGLHPVSSATVVRPDGLLTDGPYVEAKEHIGGIYVVDVPDLDVALDWARKVAAAASLPVEVRPFQDVEPF